MSDTFDLEPEFLQLYERCRNETMTSIERMYALYKATSEAGPLLSVVELPTVNVP